MPEETNIIQKLKILTPTQFENIVFDLMMLSGLKNVVWRTPGADGGRDIEGFRLVSDLSENISVEHWYIECKRYEQAIDWPTVYKKIAYADNHNADFLLLVTTSFISPRCKEEITSWGKNRKRPFIRYWDGTIIEKQILRYPILQKKYSLIDEKYFQGHEFLQIINIALKTINSAYSKAVFSDALSSDLELCAAIVDLVSARMVESKHFIELPKRRFIVDRDLYDWCELDDNVDLTSFDSFGIRVILSAIRFCGRKNTVSILPSEAGICEVPIEHTFFTEVLQSISKQASLYSNIEFSHSDGRIVFNLRKD